MTAILIAIGTFLWNHAGNIGEILATLGTIFGISWLQVFNRKHKMQEQITETKIIATATPETAKLLQENSVKKRKKDKLRFLINNIMLLAILAGIHYFSILVTKHPMLARETEFVKNIIGWLLVLDAIVIVMVCGRIVSSITTFDSFVSSLPIIKNYLKK